MAKTCGVSCELSKIWRGEPSGLCSAAEKRINQRLLSNDSLTPMQQSAQIFAALTFTIAANVLAASIGAFFAVPATGAVLAIIVTVILALINDWVNEQIALLL
jgi:hypothetical protein